MLENLGNIQPTAPIENNVIVIQDYTSNNIFYPNTINQMKSILAGDITDVLYPQGAVYESIKYFLTFEVLKGKIVLNVLALEMSEGFSIEDSLLQVKKYTIADESKLTEKQNLYYFVSTVINDFKFSFGNQIEFLPEQQRLNVARYWVFLMNKHLETKTVSVNGLHLVKNTDIFGDFTYTIISDDINFEVSDQVNSLPYVTYHYGTQYFNLSIYFANQVIKKFKGEEYTTDIESFLNTL